MKQLDRYVINDFSEWQFAGPSLLIALDFTSSTRRIRHGSAVVAWFGQHLVGIEDEGDRTIVDIGHRHRRAKDSTSRRRYQAGDGGLELLVQDLRLARRGG